MDKRPKSPRLNALEKSLCGRMKNSTRPCATLCAFLPNCYNTVLLQFATSLLPHYQMPERNKGTHMSVWYTTPEKTQRHIQPSHRQVVHNTRKDTKAYTTFTQACACRCGFWVMYSAKNVEMIFLRQGNPQLLKPHYYTHPKYKNNTRREVLGFTNAINIILIYLIFFCQRQ